MDSKFTVKSTALKIVAYYGDIYNSYPNKYT